MNAETSQGEAARRGGRAGRMCWSPAHTDLGANGDTAEQGSLARCTLGGTASLCAGAVPRPSSRSHTGSPRSRGRGSMSACLTGQEAPWGLVGTMNSVHLSLY